MELHERIRKALPYCIFHPVANERQIERVERELAVALPAELRGLYLHYDGFTCGQDIRLRMLPLIGRETRVSGDESVLSWNRFLRGEEWSDHDVLRHVVILGFLQDSEEVGIDLRTNLVVTRSRYDEYDWRGGDLCTVLVQAYEEQRRFYEELEEHVFRGRDLYYPAAAPDAQHDIDRLILAVQAKRPSQWFLKDTAPDPAGRQQWVLSVGYNPRWGKIYIASKTGDAPFHLRSDVSGADKPAATTKKAIAFVLGELDLRDMRLRELIESERQPE